jgi:hypothetical protein
LSNMVVRPICWDRCWRSVRSKWSALLDKDTPNNRLQETAGKPLRLNLERGGWFQSELRISLK